MKKLTTLALLAMLAQPSYGVEIRDSIFNASTKAGDVSTDAGGRMVEATNITARKIAIHLKDFISESLASTLDQSAIISEKVVEVSKVTGPVYRITKDGVAMVFEASDAGTDASSKATEKLLIQLEPAFDMSSEASGKVLELILVDLFSRPMSEISDFTFDALSKGSEISGQSTEAVIKAAKKVVEKFKLQPMTDATSNASDRIFKALEKALSTASDASTHVLGEENLEATGRLSQQGITLGFDATSAVFHFISGASEGITELFYVHKEAIKRAVERNDQETLASIRELIRSAINTDIRGGQTLNAFLTKEELNFYIRLRLAAMS